ncbi:hypothetical protein [Hydrogenimonas sp.]
MQYLKRELYILLVLFLLLSFAMHAKACLDHPLEHIKALSQSPLGMLHPVYITLGVYLLLLWPARLGLRGIRRIIDSRKR